MAATGNEVPLLSQVKRAITALKDAFDYRSSQTPLIKQNSEGFWYLCTPDGDAVSKLGIPRWMDGGDDIQASFESQPSGYLNTENIVVSSTLQLSGQYLTSSDATQSEHGYMSATDKQKLDSLSAPSIDIVKTTTHSTAYTKDTLEIVVDSTGKVTEMYFVSA